MSNDRRFEEALYQQQEMDVKELRLKTKRLQSMAYATTETIQIQNEMLGGIKGDMDSAQEKMRQMREKTKLALKKVGKKGAVLGTLGTVGVFALLWLLLA